MLQILESCRECSNNCTIVALRVELALCLTLFERTQQFHRLPRCRSSGGTPLPARNLRRKGRRPPQLAAASSLTERVPGAARVAVSLASSRQSHSVKKAVQRAILRLLCAPRQAHAARLFRGIRLRVQVHSRDVALHPVARRGAVALARGLLHVAQALVLGPGVGRFHLVHLALLERVLVREQLEPQALDGAAW